MINRISLLHQDQTSWLLNSADPSIRYFTQRDLLGVDEDYSEMNQARQAIASSPAVSMIFADQEAGGYWFHPDKYRSETKFYGTAWRFIILAELGLDGADPRLRKTAEYLLQRAQDPASGGFKSHILAHGARPGLSLIPCFNGMLLWSFIRFGYLADRCIQSNLNWVLEHARFDDGEIIDLPAWMLAEGKVGDDACWGRHSCIRGVGPTLLALTEIPRQQRTVHIQATIDQGLEFVLKHHVYKKSHNLEKNMNGWVTQLRYPNFESADMLDFLHILTREDRRDPRMEDALKLLVRKQDLEGKWRNQASLIKSKRQRLPFPEDAKGSPSQWITLRAMTVLKRFHEVSGLYPASQ